MCLTSKILLVSLLLPFVLSPGDSFLVAIMVNFVYGQRKRITTQKEKKLFSYPENGQLQSKEPLK